MPYIESLIIFGSNGFVGTSFLNYLSQLPDSSKPNQIILINRSKPQNPILRKFTGTEIMSLELDLAAHFSINFKATHVLNLAGDGSSSSYSTEASEAFIKICRNLANWIGTKELVRVVHASTGACSSKVETDPIYAGKRVFIDSRLEGEKILWSAGLKSGIKVVNARLFTFLGINLLNKTQYAAPSFIRSALRNGIIKVSGNPETIRSYMHEKTLSEWLYNCLTNENLRGTVNIGSSEPVAIRDLAEFISDKTGARIDYSATDQNKTIYLPSNYDGVESLNLLEGPRWFETVAECLDFLKTRGG
jgi:nucleoside-diphosphate-sugar epimerase